MTSDPANARPPAHRESCRRVLTVFVVIIGVCAAGAVLTQLRSVITPLLLGLLLLFLVRPLVAALDARHVPRWLTYLLLFVIGAAAVMGMWRLIETQANELTDKFPEYQKRAGQMIDRYAGSVGLSRPLSDSESSRAGLGFEFPFNREEIFGYIVRTSMEFVELCTMALFYLLFGLAESQQFSKRMERSLSSESASELNSILISIQHDIWRYLWTKTAISFGMGATTAVLGWLFGVDFWPLWGFLMFLANYITYIGSIVALGPPILLAFVQFENISWAVGLTVVLVVARLIWIDYVEMRLSGKQVNVSPLLVLFSVALMGWMWGAVGMLLAVPLLTVARVILGNFPQTRFVASLISDFEE